MTNHRDDTDYEECIVTFIDILGFRHLIDESSAAHIRKILRIFRKHAKPYDDKTGPGDRGLISQPKMEIVSDAVVRARTIHTDFKDGALFQELLDLVLIQSLCLYEGILIRGAVTIDRMHVGRDLEGPVFGPGLVKAYQMEEREAVYPRIIIDEAVMERFPKDKALWKEGHSKAQETHYVGNLVKSDEAGLAFVDYLRAIKTEAGDYGEYLQFLNRHAELTRQGLSAATRREVRRKYSWLRNYHNRQVEWELGASNLDEVQPELQGATLRECLEPLVVS